VIGQPALIVLDGNGRDSASGVLKMKRQLVIFGLVLSVVFSAIHIASETAQAARLTATQLEVYWRKNWKNYARRVVKLDDKYYALAAFQTTYPSSRGTTIAQLRSKTAKEISDRFGSNVKIRKHLVRPVDEVRAAAEGLPQMALGHYGHIDSGEVVKVIGPDQMILEEVWIVNEDAVEEQQDKDYEKLKRQNVDRSDARTILKWKFEFRNELIDRQSDRDFRANIKLVGFSTSGVAKTDRWKGPKGKGIKIAVVGMEEIKRRPTSRKGTPTLVAIPLIKFNTPLTSETSFLAYLKDRGFDKKSFVDLFIKEHQASALDHRLRDAKIFEALEGTGEEEEEKK